MKAILMAIIGTLSLAGIGMAQERVIGNDQQAREGERTGSCCTISEIVVTKNLDSSSAAFAHIGFARSDARGSQASELEFLGGVRIGAALDRTTETIQLYYNDITYPDELQFLEVVVPAKTSSACFENSDFSRAMPIGPDRAGMTYDPNTNTNAARLELGFIDGSVRGVSWMCRTILAVRPGESVDSAVWQVSEWKYTTVRR